jgi:2-oxoglutarate ferredoxin oxidoreductase subunit delta
MPKITISVERCKGCERCNDACPQKILGMTTKLNARGYNYAQIADGHRCIGCRLCAIACPDLAIEVCAEGTQYEFFQY